VGHKLLTFRGAYMAAVLACGPLARLSHRSAADLWEIAHSSAALADVTVPHGVREHPGIRLHRSRCLIPEDHAVREGIPVTSLARTLLDLAAVAPTRLDRALEQSERMKLFDLAAVDSLLARIRGHAGAGRLRAALAIYRPSPFTRSELERRFLELVREAGLPTPSVNAFVAGHEVDALWMDHALVVELDGYEHHRSRAAFERDRRRDLELRLAGFEVLRLTWQRVANEPAVVAKQLRSLFGA
jgi:very-short-patch-repair endonuclease